MKLLHPKMKSEDEATPPENDKLVKPKHEHVHDCKSSKFLIRAMCTIDDEMSPTRCHGMLSNSTMIVTWLMRP